MPHAVIVPGKGNEPRGWWKGVNHFGTLQRCNMLFREALSRERQRELADKRTKKVYGMSVDALNKKMGKDDDYFSVHLRHYALE
mmetsp:Transcript_9590/g.15398  ORF Transcript_9590/g.15398 Transcript_9590/m.15398 type:complete len:84 (-) Transcript_9590:71-322(-)